mmetsp:Transcript_80250/g.221916  ORF Transcript_80250/g.221916 Transcript_80250/m.221916 type:complete len:832 (+) Transcript_80250:25-2520(+)
MDRRPRASTWDSPGADTGTPDVRVTPPNWAGLASGFGGKADRASVSRLWVGRPPPPPSHSPELLELEAGYMMRQAPGAQDRGEESAGDGDDEGGHRLGEIVADAIEARLAGALSRVLEPLLAAQEHRLSAAIQERLQALQPAHSPRLPPTLRVPILHRKESSNLDSTTTSGDFSGTLSEPAVPYASEASQSIQGHELGRHNVGMKTIREARATALITEVQQMGNRSARRHQSTGSTSQPSDRADTWQLKDMFISREQFATMPCITQRTEEQGDSANATSSAEVLPDGALSPRPKPFETFGFHVQREPDQKLGIKVIAQLDGSLLVKSVENKGPVASWTPQDGEHVISVGDRVIEVNGASSNLLDELGSHTLLRVKVIRDTGCKLRPVPRRRARSEGGEPSKGQALQLLPGEVGSPWEGTPAAALGSSSTMASSARGQHPTLRSDSLFSLVPVEQAEGEEAGDNLEAPEGGPVEPLEAASDSSCASEADSAAKSAERRMASPLWLRLCGVLPWSHTALARCCRGTAIILQVAAVCLCVAGLVWVQLTASPQCEHRICMQFLPLCDLVLALGSFLGLFFLRSLSHSDILGGSESVLVSYARQQGVVTNWKEAMHGQCSLLGLLWVCSLLFRGISGWPGPGGMWLSEAAFVVASFTYVCITFGILHVCCALTTAINAYCCRLASGPDFAQLVREWNTLQTVLRRSSQCVEKGFLVMQTTALATLLLGVTAVFLNGDSEIWWLLSVAVLSLSVARILFKAAEVTEMCTRMPAFINTLGDDIDHQRQYLIQYVANSAAGFYVGEVRLTTAMALKIMYMCGLCAFGVLTKLSWTVPT